MDKGKLTVLKADVLNQLKLVEAVYRKISARKTKYTKDPVALESLAYQLHNLYCAFEDLFKLVADHFENNVTGEGGWHQELLNRMRTEISGLRPALISKAAFDYLNELRSFRHVFRHAYGFELEPAKLKMVLQKALKLKKVYPKDLAGFLKKLKAK